MYFTAVRLQNYRSYIDSSFEFDPEVNIIVGPNASGKTNLLDALHLLASGSSIKPNTTSIINNQADWAKIEVITSKNQQRIYVNQPPNKSKFKIDNKEFFRLSNLNQVPIVIFEPNQLFNLTSSTEQRRGLLDSILLKTITGFSKIKNDYYKALQQRNALLKQPTKVINNQIFAWDIRLSELATNYVNQRLQLITQINSKSSEYYSLIADKEHELSLTYDSKSSLNNYTTNLLKQLKQNLQLDTLRGFTGFGPHRDDIVFKIDDNDIRTNASRGEIRSVLLTLRMVESKLLEESFNQRPLLLLDDVFGELDGSRRKSLIDFMSGNQTFITTTDADIVSHNFIGTAKILVV